MVYYTCGVLVTIYSMRTVFVGLTLNSVCVFMVMMKRRVFKKKNVFYCFWTSVELCGTEVSVSGFEYGGNTC